MMVEVGVRGGGSSQEIHVPHMTNGGLEHNGGQSRKGREWCVFEHPKFSSHMTSQQPWERTTITSISRLKRWGPRRFYETFQGTMLGRASARKQHKTRTSLWMPRVYRTSWSFNITQNTIIIVSNSAGFHSKKDGNTFHSIYQPIHHGSIVWPYYQHLSCCTPVLQIRLSIIQQRESIPGW